MTVLMTTCDILWVIVIMIMPYVEHDNPVTDNSVRLRVVVFPSNQLSSAAAAAAAVTCSKTAQSSTALLPLDMAAIQNATTAPTVSRNKKKKHFQAPPPLLSPYLVSFSISVDFQSFHHDA